MKYLINTSNDPAFNIAFEEFCFKYLTDEPELFFLWVNSPAIIIGRHQNAAEEINGDYVRERGIKVVRRISGGGAVYHDLGNLNYTIITKRGDGEVFDFKKFAEPVVKVLHDLGVDAECSGRNDIVIHGKKICGIAQAYHKNRLLHHGCIMFNVDLSQLAKALNVAPDKIQSKGVKSVRAHVTTVYKELAQKITIQEFMDRILKEMKLRDPEMNEIKLTPEQLKEVEKIKEEKFANWNWVYGESPEFNIHRRRRYTAGTISSYIEVEKSYIRSIKIYGDFFGLDDVSDVEQALCNVRYVYEDLLAALKPLDMERYFHAISAEDVAAAICGLPE